MPFNKTFSYFLRKVEYKQKTGNSKIYISAKQITKNSTHK